MLATTVIAVAVAVLHLPVTRRLLATAATAVPQPLVDVAAVLLPGLLALPVLGRGAMRASLAGAPHARWLGLAVAFAVLDFGLSQVIGTIVERTAPPSAAVLYLTVLAPAAEEWLFRGVLWQALLSFVRPAGTVLLSAALFALFHGPEQLHHMPHLLISGILLGVLRQASSSLLPSILEHGLHNALLIAAG